MPREFGSHLRWRNVIGKLKLNGRKSGGSSRAEALDQRSFGEKVAEIGRKARYDISFGCGRTVA